MESQQPSACQEADLEGFCLVPLVPSSLFTSSSLAQGRKITVNPANPCPKWSPCGHSRAVCALPEAGQGQERKRRWHTCPQGAGWHP